MLKRIILFCLRAQKKYFMLRTSMMSRGDANYFLAYQTYSKSLSDDTLWLIQLNIVTKFKKQMIFETWLNNDKFPAWDKLNCPRVTRIPKLSNSLLKTESNNKPRHKSSEMYLNAYWERLYIKKVQYKQEKMLYSKCPGVTWISKQAYCLIIEKDCPKHRIKNVPKGTVYIFMHI